MISYKNGILKIKSERKSENESLYVNVAKNIYEIILLLSLCIMYLFATVKLVSTFITISLFLSSLFILFFRKKSNISIPYNFLWYLAVISLCAISTLWSTYYFSFNTGQLVRMVIILLMITSISIYVQTEEDLERLINIFITGVTFCCLYEFAYTPVGNWTAGWLGGNLPGNNSNNSAFWAACAGMMSFYKAYIKEHKLFYFLDIFFLVFTILSSSRKAIFIVITSQAIIILFATYKKNFTLRIIGAILAVALVFYIILTNDTLSYILGNRVRALFSFFIKNENGDVSLYLRKYFANIAKDLFVSSPIVGRGFGNYSNLLGDTTGLGSSNISGTYAHNNYLQILSELGIIGFILYYSFYVYMLVKLIKRVFIERDRLSYLFLSFLIVMIICETGIVSINSKYCHYVIALAFTSTYAANTKKINY